MVAYYFVQQELDQPRVRQISRKCSKERPAKMGREAPHFVDEAVFTAFSADLSDSSLV